MGKMKVSYSYKNIFVKFHGKKSSDILRIVVAADDKYLKIRKSIRVSNNLDPDQAHILSCQIWVQTVLYGRIQVETVFKCFGFSVLVVDNKASHWM